MPKPFPFPLPHVSPDTADDRARANFDAIRTLIGNLSRDEQDRILAELLEILRPIPAPRAGELLGVVVKFLPQRKDWSVDEIRRRIEEKGIGATSKEIYNAIGYLNRKGHVRRVGYGRYVVQGVEVQTSDDFGGATTRHEDAYRTDREE
jgi:hypothetical protein